MASVGAGGEVRSVYLQPSASNRTSGLYSIYRRKAGEAPPVPRQRSVIETVLSAVQREAGVRAAFNWTFFEFMAARMQSLYRP